MTYRFVDVETTGLPIEGGEPCGIVEIGWCDMKNHIIKPPVSHLVDCGLSISIPARAVHHISDEMVAGEIKPDAAVMLANTGEHRYTVAHNSDFEKKFMGTGLIPDTEEERPWLCTYKIALRLWPDAPGHKLMELRYFLDLDSSDDFDPKLATPAHRAAADVYVGVHLLRRILIEAVEQKVDLDRMIKWSAGPGLLIMCWMKKHKGKLWSAVARDDRSYLEWIDKSDIQDRDIRATVRYWLKQTAPML